LATKLAHIMGICPRFVAWFVARNPVKTRGWCLLEFLLLLLTILVTSPEQEQYAVQGGSAGSNPVGST
jgi:hypothetical protein